MTTHATNTAAGGLETSGVGARLEDRAAVGFLSQDLEETGRRVDQLEHANTRLRAQVAQLLAERDQLAAQVLDLESRNHGLQVDLDDALDIDAGHALDPERERFAPVRGVNAFAAAHPGWDWDR